MILYVEKAHHEGAHTPESTFWQGLARFPLGPDAVS
jgi:hypothetical protein